MSRMYCDVVSSAHIIVVVFYFVAAVVAGISLPAYGVTYIYVTLLYFAVGTSARSMGEG